MIKFLLIFNILASILFSGGVFYSSYTEDLYSFALVYGILTGMAMGLSYMVPLINAVQYFPEKKGLVSGIIVAGFGLGSLVFSFLAIILMNPDGVNVNGK